MKYQVENKFTIETLPWAEYIPLHADKLILGTFPTKVEKRRFDFFYPNKDNKFWRVLSAIAKIELSELDNSLLSMDNAVYERKKVLDKLKLGITDIGQKIYRQNNSSLDSNLFPIEYTDIFKLLDLYPNINKIILTSSSGSNSVLQWFNNYCNINGYNIKFKKNSSYPKKTILELIDKKIEVYLVYSSSGAAGKTKEELVKQYSKVINEL
ncbi:hypothetical protein [Hanstruepera marina]|uniref:hypothetical protein n=1 Tax=Hanstruepera marina TaxID=2873265 RepID=UPI001CA65A73|nr:hypothetical protein [Hanstruepera marina]